MFRFFTDSDAVKNRKKLEKMNLEGMSRKVLEEAFNLINMEDFIRKLRICLEETIIKFLKDDNIMVEPSISRGNLSNYKREGRWSSKKCSRKRNWSHQCCTKFKMKQAPPLVHLNLSCQWKLLISGCQRWSLDEEC